MGLAVVGLALVDEVTTVDELPADKGLVELGLGTIDGSAKVELMPPDAEEAPVGADVLFARRVRERHSRRPISFHTYQHYQSALRQLDVGYYCIEEQNQLHRRILIPK